LGVSEEFLADLATRAEEHYIEFRRVVKGKPRLLVMAKPRLARIQRRILERLLLRLPPSEAAYGAIRGRTAKQNATVHASADYIAKLDIKAFYPSVRGDKVYDFFIRQECSPDVARVLTLLTTRKHSLPLGTSTSPMLADQIVREIDVRLAGMTKKAGLKYTRYVDDITISGSFPLERLSKLVVRILEQNGFRVKRSKLDFYKPGDNKERIVTGVQVRDGGTFAPQAYVAQLRAELEAAAEQSKHKLVEGVFDSREHYRGRIGYVKWLDPDMGASLLRLYRKVKWRHLEWAMKQSPAAATDGVPG
jgi:RNA-directed DNA polymerase